MLFPIALIIITIFVRESFGEICLHDQNSLSCIFCSFSYYNKLLLTSQFQESDCLPKKQNNANNLLIRNILVVNNFDLSSYNLSFFDFVYHNVLTAFESESVIIKQYYYSQLIIYLTNETHYILTYNEKDYFRRLSVNLTIRPLYCTTETNYLNICKNVNDPNINIILKSKFKLYISLNLYILDIRLDGSDLVLPENTNYINNSTINQCKLITNICCLTNFYNNIYNESTNDIQKLCGLKGKSMSSLNYNDEGIINLEIIYDMDVNSITLPNLMIKNSSFFNFFFTNTSFSSFISVQAFGSQILIKNCIIMNYFSEKGFIYVFDGNQIPDFYSSTESEANFNNKTLTNILINASFCNFSLIYLNSSFDFYFDYNNTFVFFSLFNWPCKTFFSQIYLSNISNQMNFKYIVFKFAKNSYGFEIHNLTLNNSAGIIILEISQTQILLQNIMINNSFLPNYTLFQIIDSYCIFNNVNFNQIFNGFNILLFFTQNSQISFELLTFSFVNRLSMEFFSSIVNITNISNISCIFSNSISDSFSFYQTDAKITYLYFNELNAMNHIFTFSYSNFSIIEKGYFSNMLCDAFLKPMPLNYAFIIDCYFYKMTSPNFIHTNSAIFHISLLNSVFINVTLDVFIANIALLNFCKLDNNYFLFLSFNQENYPMRIFQGDWILINNLFENMIFSSTIGCLFDAELCSSLIYNTAVIFTIFTDIENNQQNYLMCHWMCHDITVNSSLFINEYHGFSDAFLLVEDGQDTFTLTNSSFILINKDINPDGMGVLNLGTPYVHMENNNFINLECINNNDIKNIFGVVNLQAFSTFSSVSNDFHVELISNTFINCSCMNGGSVSILNYNSTILNNITVINSKAKQAGFLFALNCYQMLFSNIVSNYASAQKASFIYISNTHYFEITDSLIYQCYALQSGAIEARQVAMLKINSSTFSEMNSNYGSFLILKSSSSYIINTFLSDSACQTNGGMIFLNQISSIKLLNFTSNNSFSGGNGGFLYAESADRIELENVQISNSFSSANGACLFINDINFFHLKNVKFINSHAKINGILFMMTLQISVENDIKGLLCYNNLAYLGSCIFYSLPTYLKIYNISCYRNSGVLLKMDYIYPINLFIENGNFSGNSDGNSLFLISTINLYMKTLVFHNNSMKLYLFYFEDTNAYFENLTLLYPLNYIKSDKDISLLTAIKSVISFSHTIFEGFNYAKINISLYFMNIRVSTVYISDSLIKNNIYLQSGFLFMFENSNIQIKNCLFINNSGPCIKCINSYFSISLSFFNDNIGDNEDMISDIIIEKTSDMISKVILENITINIKDAFSIQFDSLDDIEVKDSVFIGDSQNLAQSFEFLSCINVLIVNSLFFNTISSLGSALSFNSNDQVDNKTIILNKTKFILCKSSQGGAIYINGHFSIQINFNSFLQNAAFSENFKNGIGGVLVFLDSFSNYSSFILYNNTFRYNHAFIAPTIYSDVNVQDQQNIFLNNSDEINMTKTITCAPYYINLKYFKSEITQNDSIFSNDKVFQVSSGVSFILKLDLIDSLGQKLVYDNISTLIIKSQFISQNALKNIENSLSISNQGEYSLEKLIILGDADSFLGTLININFIDLFKKETLVTTIVRFHTRKCIVGEIYSIASVCTYCPENYYSIIDPMSSSLNENLRNCQICPQNALCPGGSLIIPDLGYWRISRISFQILPCQNSEYCVSLPPNLSYDNIISNISDYVDRNDIQTGYCLYGHEKNLCNECIYGFGKYINGGVCLDCKDYYVLVYVRLVIVLFIMVIYLFFTSRQMLKEFDHSTLFEEVSKVFINHFQKISLIVLLDVYEILDEVKKIFEFLNILSFLTDDIFANDCLVQKLISVQNSDKIYFFKVFITLILPFILSFVTLIIILVRAMYIYFRNRHNNKKNDIANKKQYGSKMIILFFISIFLFYPLLTKSSLSLINCISLDDGQLTYLYASPNLVCWNSTHYLYFLSFGLSGILLFGVGFPTILYLIIRNHKKLIMKMSIGTILPFKTSFNENKTSLTDNVTKFNNFESTSSFEQEKGKVFYSKKNVEQMNSFKIYHFFYKDYKSEFYYWETTIFIQKFALILLQNLNQLIFVETRNLWFIIVLLVYLIFVVKMQPFKREYINSLEIDSVLVSILTKCCIILALSSYLSSETKLMFIILQLIFNFLFIIKVCFIVWRYTNWKGMFKIGMKNVKRAVNRLRSLTISSTKLKALY